MIRRALGAVTLCCFVFTTTFPAFSQSTPADSGQTPLPYKETEFTDWQKDLRRAEIIAFGSLPFVTLLSSLSYDIFRYYDHNQDERYKPWPFRDSTIAIPKSEDEQKRILLIAVGVSIGVAVFDFSFRAIRRSIRRSRADKQNSDYVQAIRIHEIDIEPDPQAEPAIPQSPQSPQSPEPESPSEQNVVEAEAR